MTIFATPRKWSPARRLTHAHHVVHAPAASWTEGVPPPLGQVRAGLIPPPRRLQCRHERTFLISRAGADRLARPEYGACDAPPPSSSRPVCQPDGLFPALRGAAHRLHYCPSPRATRAAPPERWSHLAELACSRRSISSLWVCPGHPPGRFEGNDDMVRLPDDVTRCHDGGCPERHVCRRWLDRESGTSHAASLFPYDLPLGEKCPHRLPPEDKA